MNTTDAASSTLEALLVLSHPGHPMRRAALAVMMIAGLAPRAGAARLLLVVFLRRHRRQAGHLHLRLQAKGALRGRLGTAQLPD